MTLAEAEARIEAALQALESVRATRKQAEEAEPKPATFAEFDDDPTAP